MPELQSSLNTPMGVRQFLRNIHSVYTDRRNGDLDASLALMEFDEAYKGAGLDDREKQVIHRRYQNGLTQEETAALSGITQQTVNNVEKRAVEKIAEYVARGEDAN